MVAEWQVITMWKFRRSRGDIRNEHVLIVEDIIDTGYTLEKVRSIFKILRDPASFGDLYLIR